MKPVNLKQFKDDHFLLAAMDIDYQWGTEVPVTRPIDKVTALDCSEYIEYLLGRQGIAVPDGSVTQIDWFIAQGCKVKNYGDVIAPFPHGAGQDDSRLFCGQYARNQPSRKRHIWLVCAGWTYECGSSLGGVLSRPAGDFAGLVQRCVEIPTE